MGARRGRRSAWGVLMVALAGAAVLGAAGPAFSGATKDYADGLLTPQNGSEAAGAVALMMAAGHVTVAVTVSGLTPSSKHAEEIRASTCGSNGPVRYSLPALVANGDGDAMIVGTLAASAVPAKGFSLEVEGGGGTPLPVSCGNLSRPDAAVGLNSANGSSATGVALITRYAPVSAVLEKIGTHVVVYATGLEPKKAQEEHIHAGLCGEHAPVRYTLMTLVADAQGRALAGSGIPDIVPRTGLSIHIHNTAFKVIACGNVGS